MAQIDSGSSRKKIYWDSWRAKKGKKWFETFLAFWPIISLSMYFTKLTVPQLTNQKITNRPAYQLIHWLMDAWMHERFQSPKERTQSLLQFQNIQLIKWEAFLFSRPFICQKKRITDEEVPEPLCKCNRRQHSLHFLFTSNSYHCKLPKPLTARKYQHHITTHYKPWQPLTKNHLTDIIAFSKQSLRPFGTRIHGPMNIAVLGNGSELSRNHKKEKAEDTPKKSRREAAKKTTKKRQKYVWFPSSKHNFIWKKNFRMITGNAIYVNYFANENMIWRRFIYRHNYLHIVYSAVEQLLLRNHSQFNFSSTIE